MASRSSPLHDAQRRGQWLNQKIGRELRVNRLTSGMTQRRVAGLLHVSQSEVSRREHGGIPTFNLVQISRHAAAVGLQLSVSLWPLVRKPLDRPQLELLGRLRDRIGLAWQWSFAVPIPITGDMRAGDAVIQSRSCRCLVEAFTRFVDHQAQVRSAHLKKRDLGVDRLVLLISDTNANRAVIHGAGPILRESFPIGTRQAIGAMAAGEDAGGDALIIL